MSDPNENPALVRETSEEELLAAIFPLLPTGEATLVGPGDDSAVVSASDGRFVVSTDVLVERRHFRPEWSTGYDVGWRAAMQNLADVAAMGARPTSLVVSLVIPGHLPVGWVTGLARGLAAACSPSGAAVVGGDLSSGDDVVVAVTVHGDLGGRAPVLRSGAQVSDVVAHAGRRGWSAAGLALLDHDLGDADRELVGAYLRPEPPLAAGPAAADAGATAMLDLSDGLLRDAGRVARASGVRIDLDLDAFAADLARLARAASAVSSATGRRPAGEWPSAAEDVAASGDRAALARDWVLTGGEDHGLLATFPAGTALPEPFREVGRVVAAGPAASGAGRPAVTVDGVAPRAHGVGWDHFRG
ncbi:thiamine-phosphate kinase [Oerskovia turbata]|uniref:Thiamine-monophosphate kinase n=1 Tax=Oerskovia turbata TaxID=1713 RepID=A0A4Q1L1K5_9CELL|nr:thiamine-phosphate kinase [Oerskovia turbata]RXR28051.1 thiamine-phosphate kinase [Oerskovia turbata]RXR35940.1 thiamine-phosphate kinase [Oerskovia turbata]